MNDAKYWCELSDAEHAEIRKQWYLHSLSWCQSMLWTKNDLGYWEWRRLQR